MRLIFYERWVNYVLNLNMVLWFIWENSINFGGEGGLGFDWIRIFWKIFDGLLDDFLFFFDWFLIFVFFGRLILCRVKERYFVFVLLFVIYIFFDSNILEVGLLDNMMSGFFVDYLFLFEIM